MRNRNRHTTTTGHHARHSSFVIQIQPEVGVLVEYSTKGNIWEDKPQIKTPERSLVKPRKPNRRRRGKEQTEKEERRVRETASLEQTLFLTAISHKIYGIIGWLIAKLIGIYRELRHIGCSPGNGQLANLATSSMSDYEWHYRTLTTQHDWFC